MKNLFVCLFVVFFFCFFVFLFVFLFFFFKQKTAYEMCGRDWSSDVCSSDLRQRVRSYSLIYTDCFITCSFFVISLGLLATNSLTLAVLHVLMFIFITFACPYLLLCLQPLKNNIHGPWDEAVVHKSVS